MPETVPADIAAAIEAFERAVHSDAYSRAALDAAILHHLRAYAEMKAALDLQTSGGA
jgi:hypothetical protein